MRSKSSVAELLTSLGRVLAAVWFVLAAPSVVLVAAGAQVPQGSGAGVLPRAVLALVVALLFGVSSLAVRVSLRAVVYHGLSSVAGLFLLFVLFEDRAFSAVHLAGGVAIALLYASAANVVRHGGRLLGDGPGASGERGP